MNTNQPNPFGNGRFSREAEDLYNQFQKIFGIPEPVAMMIAICVPRDAGHLAKNYFVRPSIRYLVAHEPITSYGLALVKVCARVEESIKNGESIELPAKLPSLLKQWVDSIINALLVNDGGALARKKAGAKVNACPTCKQWTFEGRIDHSPNCSSQTWEKLVKDQKSQPSQRYLEEIKNKTAIAVGKKKAKLGPPINAPAPKKSKSHPQGSWPIIVPGGAVESNRSKF